MERPARVFADARSRRTVLIGVAVGVAVLVLTGLLIRSQLSWFTDPSAVRSFILQFGVFAPLVFVFLQATQVLVAPIPGQVFALVSGWLFGAFWGTVYSVVGATLGSFVAFSLARRYGRPLVDRLFDAEALALLDGFSSDHGYFALFVLFLLPGIPDDMICFVAGVTDLDIKRMTAVSALGRLPGYLLVNFAGSSLATARYVQTAVVLVVLGVITLIVYTRRNSLLGSLLTGK